MPKSSLKPFRHPFSGPGRPLPSTNTSPLSFPSPFRPCFFLTLKNKKAGQAGFFGKA